MIAFIRQRPLIGLMLLAAPAVLVIAVFMVGPLGLMGLVSILEKGVNGGVVWGRYSPEAYVNFLFERNLDDSLLLNTDYLKIFWRSTWLSIMTTALALLVGFPTALYMALQPERRRNLLLFLVTIPFWTNLLVRNYSWILLLRTNGLVNDLLQWLGLTSGPVILMPSSFAVAVGLVYSFLPYMVLPIYASLEKLDFRLVEAAYDLGADRRRALARVIIPLSMPGIVAGSVLVFIPCLGAFVTPELLGGGKSLMIGNLIQNQFGSARNWPFGAALAFTLLGFVLITMMVYMSRSRGRAAGR